MKKILTLLFCLSTPTLLLGQSFGKWTSADSAGFTPRYSLTSAVLDGEIYVLGGNEAGGKDGRTYKNNVFEIFNPSSNSWRTPTTTGTSTPRQKLASCGVLSKIYAIGGTGGASGTDLSTVEIYDPYYKSWTNGAAMPTARSGLVVSVVKNKIYAIGGASGQNVLNTVEVYDPMSDKWSTLATGGWFHPMEDMASCVINDQIYVFGGYDELSELDSVYIFDPASNSWTSPATTGNFAARKAFTCGAINGKIYAIGGFASDFGIPTVMNDVEVFDPVTSTWDSVMTQGSFTARYALTSSVVDGKIYALGGTNDEAIDSTFNLNEVFFPTTSSVKSPISSNIISLSPNPTTGMVNAQSASENILHISVINILGKTVLDFPNLHASDFRFDLSKFPSGVYYAKFITANSAKIEMIVRQ